MDTQLTLTDCTVTGGFRLPTETATLAEWESVGTQILAAHKMWRWYIGDWMLEGELYFGDDCWQAIDGEAFDLVYIQTAMRVARAIPPERRKLELRFSHHQAVASLDADLQDRFLDAAVRESLSVPELRASVKEFKNPGPEVEPARLPLSLDFLEVDVDLLVEVCDAAVLGDWLRRVGEAVLRRELAKLETLTQST
tara:strand:+ start:103 stop:690 length:588 start_codon:yes stop_codon:yes gene_type:complete